MTSVVFRQRVTSRRPVVLLFISAATVVWTIATACGSKPTEPSPPDPNQPIAFTILFSPTNVPFTARFQNQTFSAAGAYSLAAVPGTYDLDVTFTGSAFGIDFRSGSGMGINPNNFSFIGRAPNVQSCGLFFVNTTTPMQAQTFRVQFRVVAATFTECQLPTGTPRTFVANISTSAALAMWVNNIALDVPFPYTFSLPAGTYKAHGWYQGGPVDIAFGGANGAFQAGSLQLFPSTLTPTVEPCRITYPGSAGLFQFDFIVTNNLTAGCR